MEINKNVSLVCLGAVTDNFKTIAKLKKFITQINNNEIKSERLDCYNYVIGIDVFNKFKSLELDSPRTYEIFYPSEIYPPHKNSGGTSFFIPLESGNFWIDNISYPVLPFVLYGFEDSKLHNSDFCSIMLK